MKTALLRSIGLVSILALIPAAATAIAAVESNTYRELDQFMSVFERVRSEYVDKVDDRKLIRGAIDGMLASLDPHSAFLDERDRQNMRTQTEGAYGGLGLSVTMEDGAVKVMTPQEDTPAWRAGIKSGDYITHLDGRLLYGGTLDEAVDQMRGKPGTPISLTIVRPGRDKPFDVKIIRETIQLKPVKWEVKGDVGILNINTFVNGNTGDSVRAGIVSITKALGHAPLGYVIDLRSNPGGLLDQAIDVSDIFLERGEIVSQRGREKTDIERRWATPGDMTNGLPLVVLVDAGSASAAEIVAGALQDQKRALVLGERSFGKGSVQTVFDLGDNTSIKLTTMRYFTPSGRSVQEGGIKPDIDVPQISDPDYKSRPRVREADLRRHLVNEAKLDDAALGDDSNKDPRFSATPESLKKLGIEDFQMDYAVKTIARLGQPPMKAALRKLPPRAR